MSRSIAPGSTDQSTEIRFYDSTGQPATVSHDTAGLELWYRRNGGLKVTFAPAALAAANSAHVDGGVEPVSDGYTRVDPPDAAFASGATDVTIGGSATGLTCVAANHPLEIEASTGEPGGVPVTIPVEDQDGNPIDGALVWVTADAGGSNLVDVTRYTDDNGDVTFTLINGNTYYLWATKVGQESILGQAFVAVGDA